MQKLATPGKATCEEVAALLDLPLSRTVKCLMIFAQDRVQMLLVRGDHTGNEVKIGKLPDIGPWRWAIDAEIIDAVGCKAGYLGVDRPAPWADIRQLADLHRSEEHTSE